MTNYRNHLLFEYDDVTKKEIEARRVLDQEQACAFRASERTKLCENRLFHAKSAEKLVLERVRSASIFHGTIAQEKGEIESELFQWDEQFDEFRK